MCEMPGGYAVPDALDKPRPFEDLFGERASSRIVAAQQREPLPRMITGDARKEMKVIIHDHGIHRYRGNEHEPGLRHAQQEHHAQHAFLVIHMPPDLGEDILIQTEGWHNDHRFLRMTIRENGLELRRKIFLKAPECLYLP
jgi:hypothetical protein